MKMIDYTYWFEGYDEFWDGSELVGETKLAPEKLLFFVLCYKSDDSTSDYKFFSTKALALNLLESTV